MEIPNFFCIFEYKIINDKNMINTLKLKLLNYLFGDWLNQVDDPDVLNYTRSLIDEREYQLTGNDNQLERTIVQGFKRYDN